MRGQLDRKGLKHALATGQGSLPNQAVNFTLVGGLSVVCILPKFSPRGGSLLMYNLC